MYMPLKKEGERENNQFKPKKMVVNNVFICVKTCPFGKNSFIYFKHVLLENPFENVNVATFPQIMYYLLPFQKPARFS